MLVSVARTGAGHHVVQVLTPRADEGTTTETTVKADEPNPILPVPFEAFWAVATFLVLLVVLRYVIWPPMKKSIDARNANIREGIEAAERARMSVVAEREQYQAGIAAARAEANNIVGAARAEAEEVRSQRLAALNAELAQMRAAAAEEIAAARAEALGQLEGVVTDVASQAASRVVQRPIDAASQRPLVASFLQETNA